MSVTSNEQLTLFSNFQQELINPNSKWYQLNNVVSWNEVTREIEESLGKRGNGAISSRQILGALLVQIFSNSSDRETISLIMDTPMIQLFCGYESFSFDNTFDYSNLSRYRALLGIDLIQKINQIITSPYMKKEVDQNKNSGSISMDATVVPVNVTYPTDLKLLNKCVESISLIISNNSNIIVSNVIKKNARRDFLTNARKRKLSIEEHRLGNKKQIEYLQSLLEIVVQLKLSDKEKFVVEKCEKILEQQVYMNHNDTYYVTDRVVSLEQFHIRGIFRNKARVKTEFGPKISVSKIDGLIYMDKIEFSNYNECSDLKVVTAEYYKKFGYYPEVIRADKIYMTKENKLFCKNLKIRLSGDTLAKKQGQKSKKEIDQEITDCNKRQEIEAVFGTAKIKYGLDKVMVKLPEAQKVSIGLTFMAMNMKSLLTKEKQLSPPETKIILLDQIFYNVEWLRETDTQNGMNFAI